MEITTQDLRLHLGKILKLVAQGHEVLVTFRGRPLARIVPIEIQEEAGDSPLFGLWQDNYPELPVDGLLRELRRARVFESF